MEMLSATKGSDTGSKTPQLCLCMASAHQQTSGFLDQILGFCATGRTNSKQRSKVRREQRARWQDL